MLQKQRRIQKPLLLQHDQRCNPHLSHYISVARHQRVSGVHRKRLPKHPLVVEEVLRVKDRASTRKLRAQALPCLCHSQPLLQCPLQLLQQRRQHLHSGNRRRSRRKRTNQQLRRNQSHRRCHTRRSMLANQSQQQMRQPLLLPNL